MAVAEYVIRQGGLVFTWPPSSRRIIVADKAGRELETLPVGNVFDSRMGGALGVVSLDDVHDVIDEYVEARKR